MLNHARDVVIGVNTLGTKIVSEYDQEIPQSQTADNPMAQQERAAQPKLLLLLFF